MGRYRRTEKLKGSIDMSKKSRSAIIISAISTIFCVVMLVLCLTIHYSSTLLWSILTAANAVILIGCIIDKK